MTIERHPLSRRSLLRTAAGAVAATALGGGARALASGDDALGGLEPVREYADWRRTWDLIVPLATVDAWPRMFLLYDRAAGVISVNTVDEDGAVSERRLYTDARRSWDIIAPANFARSLTSLGLVFYDRAAGYGSLQAIDQLGGLRELRGYPNWRRTWDLVVPFSQNDILLYDRAAGYASFQTADVTGGLREVRSYNDFSTGWSLVTPGTWNLGVPGRQDLLFYDRNAGQATFFAVDAAANMTHVRSFWDWQSSWDYMSGENLTFTKGSGYPIETDLMLFDYANGRSVYFDVYPDGNLGLAYDDTYESSEGWTHVTTLGPDLLLFYNRPTGRALFLRTDFPPPLPRPTPWPTPWPTVVPTPTLPPRPQPSAFTGTTRVAMEQARGSSGNNYAARVSDPVPGAIITSVTNNGPKRISLTHWGNGNRRIGPVYVKAGQTVYDFNGLSVAGEWQATIDGSQKEAPKRFPLEVGYEYR